MALHIITVVDFSERTSDVYAVYAEDEEAAMRTVIQERGGDQMCETQTLGEMLSDFESDDIEVNVIAFDVGDFDDHIITNPAHGKVHELVAN